MIVQMISMLQQFRHVSKPLLFSGFLLILPNNSLNPAYSADAESMKISILKRFYSEGKVFNNEVSAFMAASEKLNCRDAKFVVDLAGYFVVNDSENINLVSNHKNIKSFFDCQDFRQFLGMMGLLLKLLNSEKLEQDSDLFDFIYRENHVQLYLIYKL